jgi:hypothetical protein
MTNSSHRQSSRTHRSQQSQFTPSEQTEADLLNALVDSEAVRWELRNPVDASVFEVMESPKSKISYPWNPSQTETESFFSQNDAAELLNCFEANELDQQANQFFKGLDQIWEKSLQTTLMRKFAMVPQAILGQIADQAAQVAKTSNSLIDQLALCVQSALPQWDLEDLQVLARPMAYAMRGEAAVKPDASLTNKDWAELSETERAKLTLAIAHYALHQLDR